MKHADPDRRCGIEETDTHEPVVPVEQHGQVPRGARVTLQPDAAGIHPRVASPYGSFGPWMEVHGQSPARGVHLVGRFVSGAGFWGWFPGFAAGMIALEPRKTPVTAPHDP
jgi:hypothetical protein